MNKRGALCNISVQIGRKWRQPDRLYAYTLKNRIKLLGVLFIAVMNEIFRAGKFTIISSNISGNLSHPFVRRIRGDAGNENFAGAEMDEKKDVIRYEPELRPDLSGEEISCPHNIHVKPEEFSPRHSAMLAVAGRVDAVSLEKIRNCAL